MLPTKCDVLIDYVQKIMKVSSIKSCNNGSNYLRCRLAKGCGFFNMRISNHYNYNPKWTGIMLTVPPGAKRIRIFAKFKGSRIWEDKIKFNDIELLLYDTIRSGLQELDNQLINGNK